MRLLVLSDIHGYEARLNDILASCPERDGIVFVGDLLRRFNAGAAASLLSILGLGTGRLLAVAGNMDGPALEEIVARQGCSLHGTGMTISGAGFFGVGGSNPTPFHTPFELPEDVIFRLLEQGYAMTGNAVRKVLVTHVPPIQCRIDRTGSGIHAGSTAVRRFLKEYPVTLCLCGHIHEAAGEETVEDVPCVNVGAVRDGRYAWLDITDTGIRATMQKTIP
jgi:uncharacterized protein